VGLFGLPDPKLPPQLFPAERFALVSLAFTGWEDGEAC
jgi:hypothetical protein